MDTEQVYHYVYRITNTVERKHYYGSRKSILQPKEDLGKKYFSSSVDIEFIADQKINPQNYKYKVVSIHSTHKEALAKEIKLHYIFNVGTNPSFYNRCKAISTGFSTEGSIHTEETKAKISKSRKGTNSRLGYKHTEETRKKISEKSKGRIISDKARKKASEVHKNKVVSEETRKKISESRRNSTKSKVRLVNIYNYNDDTLIAKSVLIGEWALANGYNEGNLRATTKADRNLPHKRVDNPRHTKGVYAVYQDTLVIE